MPARYCASWISSATSSLGASLMVLACSSTGVQSRPVVEALPEGSPPEEVVMTNTQLLFRVRYSGPEGSGSLRLVLRMLEPGRFQLTTADALGRALWSLEVEGERTLVLDHRRKSYCESDQDLRLSEVTLETFPLRSLPRLLLGELPVELEIDRSDVDSQEVEDGLGRRWLVRSDRKGITAWTLWVGDEPGLWWTRQAKGGILSHRDGSQFRWRQTVAEPITSSAPPLSPPEEFDRESCHDYDLPEFRQDQPAPPGAGAAA